LVSCVFVVPLWFCLKIGFSMARLGVFPWFDMLFFGGVCGFLVVTYIGVCVNAYIAVYGV
jgi:hypothetical protein